MTTNARQVADRRILCPVLIGRDAELSRLDTLVQECLGGRGRTAFVSGEAGVGKTALLKEFVKRASGAGARVLVSECTELDARRPFGPFMEIARGSDRLADLHLPSSESSSVVGDRYQLYSAFAALFHDLSRERPTVIVIEDLHWGDEASLALFPHLARKLRDMPLLLIGSYRTDELHRRHPLRPVLADLRRSRVADDVTLPRLGGDDVAAFLTGAMRLDRPPTAEFRDAIHRTCEGNPLFMEEVLRALAERGDVELRGGSWLPTKNVAEIAIPDTLRDAVLERFNSLSTESQEILRRAAVIGQRFDFDLLSVITRQGEETIVAALRAGIDAQLLQEVSDAAGSETYTFRHALSRESIAHDLLGRELRFIHAAVAQAIEARAGPAPAAFAEDLAYHFDEAGDIKRASLYHELAADEALAVFAYRRAVEHLDRVVALGAGDDPTTARTLLRLADAARAGDNQTRCVRAAMDARRLYSCVGDTRGEADALGVAATAYADLRDYERAVATAGEAARILEPYGASTSLGAAYHAMARTTMFTGDYAQAIAFGERAVAIARSVGATDDRLHAEVTLGTSLAKQARDRTAEGVRLIRSAIEEGISTGSFLATDRGFANLCDVLRSRAPANIQRAATAEYATYARKHTARQATALCCAADLPLVDGDWDSVLRIAAERVGEGHYADWLQLKEAFVRVGRAGPAAGLPLIREPQRGLADLAWPLRTQEAVLVAQVFALAGEHAKGLAFAEDYATAAGGGFPDRPLDGLTICAIQAARASGDPSAARRWIRLALDAPQHVPVEFDPQRWYATAEHRADEGDIDGALVSLEESARIFADAFIFDSPHPLTAIGLRRVELLLERGDDGSRATATAEFALVLPYWRRAKATWYLEQLKIWAARRGLAYPAERSPETVAVRTRAALTAREREVVQLVAKGLSNKEIAEKLVISERTAEGHVERILGKLEFRSRSQIAAWQAGGNPTRSGS